MEKDYKHVLALNELLREELLKHLTHITFNGDMVLLNNNLKEHRYPGNLNVSFAGVEGEGLMVRADCVAMSSGSACTSESLEPSYVLKALGAGDEQAHTSIRMGLGRFTTKEEVLTAVKIIVKQVNELREMSPLWEMIEEGIDLSKIEWTQEH